jgi:HEPN domain-containing protein
MAEYDIAFAMKLADTASVVVADGIESVDAQRTVLYLSLLASEIALKALLEKAGKPVHEIRSRSHNLQLLLGDIDRCEIKVDIARGLMHWCPASRLRSEPVDERFSNATVGRLLEAEDSGASTYPNQIRYGDLLRHYPADVIAKMASAICAWARANWDTIRVA